MAYEKLNCLVQGTGPELMFVHGAGGNAAAWWQQLEYFSKTRRTLAYDLPGFGRSEAVSAQAIPESFTNAALSVLDRFHVQQADVVCQSLGGWAGIHLALEHPRRVKKLVLSCTMAGIAHGPAMDSFMTSLDLMDETGPAALGLTKEFEAGNPAKAYLYRQLGAFNPGLSDEVGAKIFAPETLVPLDRLKDVQCPVLIVAGAKDQIWPPQALEGLIDYFPNARMQVIEDTGHSPYFELPETFNGVIEMFLNGG